MTQRKQNAPFPGFSMDHFNYGLQMGLDQHGNSQFPWESPFQHPSQSTAFMSLPGRAMGGPVTPGQPYMVGENGPEVVVPQQPGYVMPNQTPPWAQQFQDPYGGGFNPPGQPGMGDIPGPGMGMGPQGPMGPGQDFGGLGGMAGDTQTPQAPQQSVPQPWQPPQGPVMGDEDLAGNPDYAAASASAHPKWNRFMQYMNTPEARDSMFMGVILSQMGTNPQAALQMAMQFKEHIAQRNWQAQQNEMNRQARIEQGKQSKVAARASKVRAAALQNGIDLSPLGTIDESNVDLAEAHVDQATAAKKAAEATGKQQDAVSKEKRNLLNDSLKHEVDATKYTDPSSPTYDPGFKNALLSAGAFRDKRAADSDQRNQLLGMMRKSLIRLDDTKTANIAGKLTDTQKATLAANRQRAAALIKSAEHDNTVADNYEVYGDNWGAAQQMYQSHHAAAKDKMVEGINLLNKIAANPTRNYEDAFAGIHEDDANAAKEAGATTANSNDDEINALLKKYPGAKITLPPGAAPDVTAADPAVAKKNAIRAKLGLPPEGQ